MLVNVLKQGIWSFKGVENLNIEKGVQELKDDLAKELIDNGWAELPKEKVPESKEIIQKPENKVESVEKKRAGWWYVKYEDREDVVKVRGADDKDEAIILANAELEVQ